MGRIARRIRQRQLAKPAKRVGGEPGAGDSGLLGLIAGLTGDAFPQCWATIQNNLTEAYSDRIRGERTENLEWAISAHEVTLVVRTRVAFPEERAITQSNLGTFYSEHIVGVRAKNLE